jgi:hypothetical protein
VPEYGTRCFVACGRRQGLLALDLGSIFEKLLHQKTFNLITSKNLFPLDPCQRAVHALWNPSSNSAKPRTGILLNLVSEPKDDRHGNGIKKQNSS